MMRVVSRIEEEVPVTGTGEGADCGGRGQVPYIL